MFINITGVSTSTSFYGSGEGPPFIILYCTGIEKSIFDCRYDKRYLYCYDGNIPGIKCEGKGITKDKCTIIIMNRLIFSESCSHGRARVRGSSSEMVGRIEVCIQETWRTICSDQWKEEDASVLCNQLGFSVYGLLYLILEIEC